MAILLHLLISGSMTQQHEILDTDQKALEVNLDDRIYGTLAEIGAGQEVARIFFKVGAAAGTIAKTMSAYDKTFSDNIYGVEESGRYVGESRLYKMLDHEYDLLHSRLKAQRPGNLFFVFADTIAAMNYQRTIQGHGWLGVRFQLRPDAPPNDIVVHVKMLDQNAQLQQSAIGVLGVNMIYACFYYHDDIPLFIRSLTDGVQDRLVVDLVRLTGPDFDHLDNRLLSLEMVRSGLTDVTMFDELGQPVHASEFLYRKSLMVVRGHFRPPTLVTQDVFDVVYRQFLAEQVLEPDQTELLAELTLDYLTVDGTIDHDDYLARVKLLSACGRKVIVSNCITHVALIRYLQDFKIRHLGVVIGIRELALLLSSKYEEHSSGMLLTAFGELFTRNLKVYAYPALNNNMRQVMTLENMPVPGGIAFLIRFLVESHQLVQVEGYDAGLLSIIPEGIYQMIRSGTPGWEAFVPVEVAREISKQGLFGFQHKLT